MAKKTAAKSVQDSTDISSKKDVEFDGSVLSLTKKSDEPDTMTEENLSPLDFSILDEEFHTPRPQNLHLVERLLSGIVGSVVLLRGIKKHSWVSSGLGAFLVYRSIRGYSFIYDWLSEYGFANSPKGQSIILDESITISFSNNKIYDVLKNPDQMFSLLGNHVTLRSKNPKEFIISLSNGQDDGVEFLIEMVANVENRLLSWRSSHGSLISHEGSIYLRTTKNNQTMLRVNLKYDPPIHPLLKKLFDNNPERYFQRKIDNFRLQLETNLIKKEQG